MQDLVSLAGQFTAELNLKRMAGIIVNDDTHVHVPPGHCRISLQSEAMEAAESFQEFAVQMMLR
jgi:hypothetical protein